MRTTALVLLMLAAGCHAPSPPPPTALPADSAPRGMMTHREGGMPGMHADSGHRGMMPHGGGGMRMHADSAHRGMMPPGRMRHGVRGAHAGAEAAGPRDDAFGAGQQCPASTPALVEQGRAVFGGRGNCAACHGADGRGTLMAPDLTDAGWLHGDGSYPWLADLIATGVARPLRHPAPMPPRGGADLSAAEVCAVAAYVRSRAG